MIRVACVGDSLTFGYLVERRESNCYPSRLSEMLGNHYLVKNFGVNGHTMLKLGDAPFWEHENFKLSSEFNPDMVIIMLGTNDSKPHNWTTVADYARDYAAMIKHYQELSSHPKVYLMTPPTAFVPEDEAIIPFGISNERIQEMRLAIKDMGNTLGLKVIDLNEVTANHPEFFPVDGVHTNAEGANFIATTVYRALI